jgi:hypothetical protein
MSLLDAKSVCAVGSEELVPRELHRIRDRSEEQRRKLRAGEPSLGNQITATAKYSEQSLDYLSGEANTCAGVRQPLRPVMDIEISSPGNEWRGHYPERQGSRLQGEGKELEASKAMARIARVYDIANAGPRRCFTVSGKLVLNCILGIGNGLKAKGLFERYMESFPARKCLACVANPGKEAGVRGWRKCGMCDGTGMQSGQAIATQVLDVCEEIAPEVFAWQRRVQKLAHEQQYLKTEFGHIRRFYEVFRWDGRKGVWGHGDQAEEAIAFWLANIAFGHIREAIKDMSRERELDKKWGLFNHIHDSFQFEPEEGRLDEHVGDLHPVLTAPSKVLINSRVAPRGLVIDVEASVGRDWASVVELRLPKTELFMPQATVAATVAEAQHAGA